MSEVDAAVDTINDRLSQHVFDWDVSHGDLIDIHNALDGLDAGQRNEAITALDDGQLEHLANEIHGAMGSLDAQERQSLFNTLGAGLDAGQMVRMVAAFDAAGHPDSIRELGAAVASQGTPEAQVAFVEAMATRTTEGAASFDPEPLHKNDVTDNYVADPDALAVAEVLGSLEGGYFDEAIAALEPGQLDAVMQAGIGQTEVSSRNGDVTNFDTGLISRIVDSAATGNDTAVQAAVFAAAASRLEVIQNGDNSAVPLGVGVDARLQPALDGLTDSLTGLLNADTTGIVAQLETTDRYGDALTSYITEQVSAGREAQVGELIAKLHHGNDLSGDAMARFGQTDASGEYQHAHVLGYFMGATEAGVQNATDGRVAEAEAIREILAGGVSLVGIAGGGPAAGAGRTGATFLSDGIIDHVVDGYRTEGDRLSDVMLELGYPRDADDVPFEGASAETVYDTARARVIDRQTPG